MLKYTCDDLFVLVLKRTDPGLTGTVMPLLYQIDFDDDNDANDVVISYCLVGKWAYHGGTARFARPNRDRAGASPRTSTPCKD